MKYATHKNWGAIKKNQKKSTTSRQPRKLIFGIQPYLTQLYEICKKNSDWGAIQQIKNWGAIKKLKKNWGAIKNNEREKMTI